MSNVLITGINGFIGVNLASYLLDRGYMVVGLGSDRHKYFAKAHHIVYGDIRDQHLLSKILADYEIDKVFHLAAQSIVKTCASDPYSTYQINIMGTVSLLEACRLSSKKVSSIVINTSDKAYGSASVPYTEDTPLSPKHIYETSKACQDMIGRSYFYNYDLPIKIARCSNIYGPYDHNLSRIIPRTILNIFKGNAPVLYNGVENYKREFVFVEDVCSALTLLSEKEDGLGEAYCIGGTGVYRIGDVIDRILELMNSDIKPQIVVKDKAFKEIEEQYIDARKICSIGWNPRWQLEQGLPTTIEHYVKNIGDYDE